MPGTTGVDVITGTVSSLQGTLQATDSITGGTGNDRLNIDMSLDFSGFTKGGVSGVETIQLTNTGGTVRSFDATGVADATTIVLKAANAGLTLVDLPTGVKTLSLDGQTTGTLTTSFVAGAAETGAAALTDAMTLNLNGVGGTTATTAIDLTINSIEQLNINSIGTNNIDDLGATRKMAVAGSGDITIRTVSSSLTEFDGSAATGTITATLTNAAASALKVIKGGSAADTFTVVQADLPSTASIVGGDGADTLSYSTAAAATTLYKMSGVENLSLTAVATGALTFIGTDVTDLSKVTTVAAVAQAVTLTDMKTTNMEFVSSGTTVDAGDVTSDHTGTTVLNLSALAATTTARTAADTPAADYTFSAATGKLTVNVNDLVNAGDGTTGTAGVVITADKAGSVELNVAAGKLSGGTTDVTEFDGQIFAAAATSIAVNATGILNGAITAGEATSAVIVNGSNAAAFNLATAKLTSLNITSGANIQVDAGAALTKVQSLTVNASKGITTFGNALAAANSVSLQGSGTTSEVVLNTLGAATNGYGLTLSAQGLASEGTAASPQLGLTVGAITVGTGYDVAVNTSSMTGGATIASITSTGTTDIPKNIEITAAGMGGLLTVTGAILGSGNVTVNAKGAYDVALTTIQGAAVTVDVSGTTESGGVVIGDITAKTSANVTYQTGAANTQAILATSDSTALAVTVNGGALVDTITITGGAAQTTLTVAGNLGASTDVLTVTNTAATATGINISAMTNYDGATLTTGAGAQNIVGGAGADIIRGGANTALAGDSLTGGAGKDSFRFNNGDSPYTAPDVITDFAAGDEIWLDFKSDPMTLAADRTAVAGTTTAAALDAYGVVTFATLTTAPTSLLEAATLVEAIETAAIGRYNFFAYGGKNYIFFDDGNDLLATTDLVIELTGVSFPTATLADANTDTAFTGLSGFGV